MKKFFLMLVCVLTLSNQTVKAQEEVATNAVIIQLLTEGFTDEEIIGFIENTSTREIKSDLQSMRELKQHNASAELIKYIQKIAKTDFGYDGVYWWNTSDYIVQILKLKRKKVVLVNLELQLLVV